MHKKSIEAATKMKEEEGTSETEKKHDVNDDVRTESIAALRARAQQHSSKMMQALQKGEKGNNKTMTTATNNNFDNLYSTEHRELVRH